MRFSTPPRAALIFSLGLAACASQTVVVDGETMTEDQAARRSLDKARAEAEAGRPHSAEARYRDVLEMFPRSAAVPGALDGLAHLKLESAGCDAARLYDERLLDEHPTSPEAEAARARREACAPRSPVTTTEPTSTLRQAFERASSDAEKKAVASEAADAALDAGDALEAVRWLYEVRRRENEPAQVEALDEEIRVLAREQLSARGVRALVEELSADDFLYEELSYRLGAIQLHVGDIAGAEESLQAYLQSYPTGLYSRRAQSHLDEIGQGALVRPSRLGVLIPLSGRHRSYGELALQAIRLAIPEQRSTVELVVRDTKSDAVEAARQAESLILEEGVIGILGPIFTYAAQPAALEAQRLGTPLLTVSAARDIPRIGPYIFRNGVTNEVQTRALVAYVMDVLEMKRFAILYPRHPYGEEMLHRFWDEVEARGGEIRGVESYGLQDTTFSRQVKALVARDDIERRQDYREAIEACETQPDSYRKARCAENVRKSLPPIIDFDGLFIPDYPRSLSMITAALAFEDVIVEQDPRRLRTIEKTLGRTVTPVTLLGASGWNSDKLIERADRNVENAIFTDGFFASASDPATVDFVRRYRDAHGRTPRLYPEALFFDSAQIFRSIIEQQKPPTREALREALRGVHDFAGVTGATSFRDDTDAAKTVHILTIRDGTIREAPSTGPDGPGAAEATPAPPSP